MHHHVVATGDLMKQATPDFFLHRLPSRDSRRQRAHSPARLLVYATLALCAACHKPAPPPQAGAAEVTVMPGEPHDTPAGLAVTAKPQSSREAEIRARGQGF